jgi:DNA (cytosine-5)-methyltransferase 1
MIQRTFTTIDLFCGAGGLTEGFRRAGFECVLANDIDQQAIQTFQHNHADVICLTKDIQEISTSDFECLIGTKTTRVDVLCGGPPCQGFSLAGLRFTDDPRNKLFLDFVRVAKYFEPTIIVFENVPGLTTMQGGAVLTAIVAEFEKLGYCCQFRILNSADYGVPQMRQRFILLGVRNSSRVSFPEPTHFNAAEFGMNLFLTHSDLKPYVTAWEALSDLPPIEAGEGSEEMAFNPSVQNDYQKSLRGTRRPGTLFNHRAISHSDVIKNRYSLIPEGETNASLPEELRTKKRNVFKINRAKPSPTVTCNHRTDLLHPIIPRGSTVREAARLQSFPDDYRFFGNLTRKAKWVTQDDQVGNAVPPILAQAIAEHIKAEYLSKK